MDELYFIMNNLKIENYIIYIISYENIKYKNGIKIIFDKFKMILINYILFQKKSVCSKNRY